MRMLADHVNHHEVVAQSVHFGEMNYHLSRNPYSGWKNAFQRHLIVEVFAATRQMQRGAIDQNFGRTIAAVVVRTHAETIGARRANRQQITLLDAQFALLAEKIAGFADRPDHIIEDRKSVG